LPRALPYGEISGVCARGGFELSFSWKNGKLEKLKVDSKAGQTCRLRYGDKTLELDTRKGKSYYLDGKLGLVNN
jgi:alpha-L-fucosidase 2